MIALAYLLSVAVSLGILAATLRRRPAPGPTPVPTAAAAPIAEVRLLVLAPPLRSAA